MSLDNDRGRPAYELDALMPISLSKTTVTDVYDIALSIERELVHWEAGYRLGWSVGFDAGFRAGADDAFDRVQSVLTGCTSVWSSRSQEELRVLRNDPPITRPCHLRCRWCIVCRRYARWWRETSRVGDAAVRAGPSQSSADVQRGEPILAR